MWIAVPSTRMDLGLSAPIALRVAIFVSFQGLNG
jgi:hypothetical protein